MKKLSIYISLIIFCCFPSCDFGDMNVDPTRPIEASLEELLPAAIVQSAYNQSAISARISGVFVQQLTGFDAKIKAYTEYLVREEVLNNYWGTGLYAGVLKSCRSIIDKAQKTDSPYYEAMAKIIMAHNFGAAASYFGDIPFLQASLGNEHLEPVYDPQETVFIEIQKMLDESISLLNGTPGTEVPAEDDLVFGGNPAGWISYAYALKARFAVYTSNREADWSQIAAWANEGLSAIAAFDYSTAPSNNPLAKFGQERPNTIIINNKFADLMTDNADPRQSVYMENNGSEWIYFNGANPSLKWAAASATIPMVSDVELKFIIAEAALNTGGDVQTALNEAIQASMDLNEVEGADYIANRGDISDLAGEAILKRIIEEAYVAYYGFGFTETWANFRRTGYPDLTPDPNGNNSFNPSGGIPKRFMYPESERRLNAANRDAAVANQGGALLDDVLWCFQ